MEETADPMSGETRLRKGRCCCGVLTLLLAALLGYVALCFRDRSGGYTLDLSIPVGEPGPLRVGFAKRIINPDLSGGPVWIAGFANGRAATAIHDDLWAIACVIDDGTSRVGVVALDAIGFFHDDVVEVRRRLAKELELDYAIVCATHNHSTPDLLGLWGEQVGQSGVDSAYREHVIAACVEALAQAASSLGSASMTTYAFPLDPKGLVEDTRKPEVFDSDLRVLFFRRGAETLGSIVTWANHPETPWSKNTEITADFPGFLREGLEHGLHPDDPRLAGLGGTHLFINGAVGGLMTTSPRVSVQDPVGESVLKEASHAKSRAVGYTLARRILTGITESDSIPVRQVAIGVEARTIALPVRNPNFLLAPLLGVLDRGHVKAGYLGSEVGLVTVGDASLLCIPGEIYPELVNGGVERAPGADFDLDPVEIPPLRELMPGKLKLVFGLANDEIGYIIPKSEWDAEPPYIYGSEKDVYGEVNSLGPETAPLIHQAVRRLISRRKGKN